MTTQHQKALLLPLLFFCSIQIPRAEPATLSDDLRRLHIPVLQYQNQYLWADLDYQSNPPTPITFTVHDYGFLDENNIPPRLYDLSQVTEGVAPAIVDIKGTEARLTFVSTIPLACSVIYGKTTAFGAVSTDANMNGGAIIDHNPILTNLEPETLYYYRVQGTDAQGKLYWEPVASFTTAATDTSKRNLFSLDNGARISAVSSNFGNAQNSDTWGANNAIDGSSSSAWSSNGDGDNAFIEITLPRPESIDNIEVWSRSMSDGSAKTLSFTITIDNGEVLGPFQLADTQKAHQFNINRTSSLIRFEVVSSTGGNTGLIEISAYTNSSMANM